MLNCSASLSTSTSVLIALPGKLDIKRHSPGILLIFFSDFPMNVFEKVFIRSVLNASVEATNENLKYGKFYEKYNIVMSLKMQVSSVRKYDNSIPQTNPWHREKETQNTDCHKTPRRQLN